MSPHKFETANRKLLPSGHEYSLNVESIEPLWVYTDNEQCLSCWKPTHEELEMLNLGASVVLHCLTGASQPPVGITVQFVK